MTVEHGSTPNVALSQHVSPHSADEELNAIQVFYGHPDDPAAFRDYLVNVHVPLAKNVPGVQEILVHTGLTGMDQSPGEVYMIGTVVFGSQSNLESGLASQEGQAAYADVAKFATGGFTAYLAHVESLTRPGHRHTGSLTRRIGHSAC